MVGDSIYAQATQLNKSAKLMQNPRSDALQLHKSVKDNSGDQKLH